MVQDTEQQFMRLIPVPLLPFENLQAGTYQYRVTASNATNQNYIVINHGNGMQTWYQHLSSMNVTVGQTVARGQVIGNVGTTGISTGPHLHFEVHVGGVPVNPLNYL